MRVRSCLLAGAVLLTVTAGVPTAHAADAVACGDTITASTQLTHDLACPAGAGLTVIASGTEEAPLVLDLNGHTISGAAEPGEPGVLIAGQNFVVVRNGTVAGFHTGVEVQQSTRVTLTGLTVQGVDRGVNVAGGGYHLIEKNDVTADQRDGIRLGATTNTLVARNDVHDAMWGISIGGYTTSNFVELNTLSNCVRHGIGAFDNVRAVAIVRNEVAGNAYGIFVGREVVEARVELNEAKGNRDDDIRVDTDSAALIENATTGSDVPDPADVSTADPTLD